MAGVTPTTLASRLTRIQSFKETIWGTPGIATARWMMVKPTPTFTYISKNVFVDEDRGSFAPAFVTYVPETGGAFNINLDASFEDIIFGLAGMMGSVNPTGGGPYTWAYAGPLTSAWAPQSYSLELAYDIATVIAQGCLSNKMSIKFNAKNDWTVDLSGFFQQMNQCAAINIASSTNASPIEITTTPAHGLSTGMGVVIAGHLVNTAANGTWTIIKTGANTFTLTGSTGNGVGAASGTVTQSVTPGISDRTVEPILFAGETALAIDAAGGTVGSTSVPNAFVSGQIDIENQQQGFFTGDQKYPVDWSQDKFKVNLTLRLKWNAQVKALYDSLVAGNSKLFQIKATSGSKSAQLDFSGALSADPQNYNLDYGAITQELKFDGVYDVGAFANYFKATVINSVSALP